VDKEAARTELARWKGKDAAALRADTAFFQGLADGRFDRVAVLHFVRTVAAAKMQEAMTEAMDRGVPAGDPARAAFLALWSEELREGEEVALHFSPAGKVSLIRGGRTVGAVESIALARSLMQSWVGPDPVSTDIQAGIVGRFPDLLR
jgi:hypothetical protein